MTYSQETEFLMAECKEQGFNLWPMLAVYKKRSKLKPAIPDEVIQAVCRAYLGNERPIRADFPYFMQTLKRKTEEYFAKQNINEGNRLKKEPTGLGNIFAQLARQSG